jgi:hypothetical protein
MMKIAATSKSLAQSPQEKADSQILTERAVLPNKNLTATSNTLNDGRQPVLKVFEDTNLLLNIDVKFQKRPHKNNGR